MTTRWLRGGYSLMEEESILSNSEKMSSWFWDMVSNADGMHGPWEEELKYIKILTCLISVSKTARDLEADLGCSTASVP